MVKAINQQLMSPGTALFYFVGLSTDTKPTGSCDNQLIFNGSVFDEIDTGKEYVYDESGVRWCEQPEGSKKKDDPTAEEISVSRGAADAGKVIVVGEDGKLLPVDLDSTGAVAIDRTLKVSGAAADAKETGDALASLNGSLASKANTADMQTALAGKAGTAVATSSSNGLMSAQDKITLDAVAEDYSSALTALGVI